MMIQKKEYGDFQTPVSLATDVVSLIAAKYGRPGLVIEPTCGLGNFLAAALNQWGCNTRYQGYEINPQYCATATNRLSGNHIEIRQCDFFSTDWNKLLSEVPAEYTLVLGNPPWVTNAALGSMNSLNLPEKTNFQGLRGFDAKTGKANFDIAEWMLIRLVESLPPGGVLGMLCKTATARKVLAYLWQAKIQVLDEALYKIDAKEFFGASVDACLFVLRRSTKLELSASVYNSLSHGSPYSRFGIYAGELIANLDDYGALKELDGYSCYKWRSGVKHDAASVMELTPLASGYSNGIGEILEIEDTFIYPLLKSSDLGNSRLIPRRHVIITQTNVGEDTLRIRNEAPRTWEYLEGHGSVLDSRKSSIYLKRPRFSVFGIGTYSFSPWKVAISGLYKDLCFSVIGSVAGKPTMVDDTCYFFPCETEEEAVFWGELLNGEDCIKFLHSLIFMDAKRPVTIDVLRRIDLAQLARRHGVYPEALRYLEAAASLEGDGQRMLVFENKPPYKSKKP